MRIEKDSEVGGGGGGEWGGIVGGEVEGVMGEEMKVEGVVRVMGRKEGMGWVGSLVGMGGERVGLGRVG